MNWFLFALIPTALWSICNHIDKYLIEKYFKGGGAGALIIFSSLIGIFVLPLIWVFHPGVFDISKSQAVFGILNGIVSITAILIYLYAMKKGEASVVVPLFQMIPVFYFILGFVFLGEVLTQRQILGSLLIILSGVTLSLDLENKIPRLKAGLFFFDGTFLFFNSCKRVNF